MRCVVGVWTIVVTSVLGAALFAQAQDASRVVKDGGISVPGWRGLVDPQEKKAGHTLEDARLAPTPGGGLHVTTGPAVTYWNPQNTATGHYTVRATFTESGYMTLNPHPHPYGIFVAGQRMDTDKPSLLYCSAYGNGTFIVRGFGPEPFRLGAPKPTPHPAVKEAAGKGASVTQQIAVTVTGESIECAINGTVVARYPRAEVVGLGRLESTDGVYGIRVGHNADVVVTGLEAEKR